MRNHLLLPLATATLFGVACSDVARAPTEALPERVLFGHTPSHPGEPHYELTLTAAADAGTAFATLATTCDDRGHVIADERDESLRAGGAEKPGLEEDRFQLRFTPDESSHELFGEGPVCLGNVRPEGDWRDDLIIWYDRARGRHPASVSMQWYFTHGEGEQERRYRLTGGPTTTDSWSDITSGEIVDLDGSYRLQDITAERNWPTVAEGQLKLAFTAKLLEGDGDGGGGGDDDDDDGGDNGGGNDGECRPHPVHDDRCR